jgi:hypothetical protein
MFLLECFLTVSADRGGQIIQLPTTKNSPTATEPTLTAYRLPKKKIENWKSKNKFISEYIVGR